MPLTPEEIAKIQEEERVRAQEREKYAPAQNVSVLANQKYGLPTFLSFFIPGLGQVVKGEIGKGILIFIVFVIGCFCFVIPGIIIWVWQLIDAYNYNNQG